MVIKELISESIGILRESGNENPVFEAHLTVRTVLKLSPLDIVLKGNSTANPDDAERIRKIIFSRASGEPLEYILGTQEFMGLEFTVNPDVLIPRKDTEILVEHVLSHFAGKPITVLDLCTGSGCIGISVAHFNKNAFIKGVDISEGAIKTATKNAELLSVKERTAFEVADIFKTTSFGKFDLIVSNPPYIESGVIPTLSDTVKNFEPLSALDGGSDGLIFYRHIVKTAPKLLNPGGMLAFEIGYNQREAVTKLMEKDFYNIEALKDFANNDRVVSGILR